jgi:hypothetical protein
MDDDLLHELRFVSGKEYKAHAMEQTGESDFEDEHEWPWIAIETWAHWNAQPGGGT